MSRLAVALIALASLTRTVRADEAEPLYTCKAPPASAKLTVSFRPDSSLVDLATWVTSFTCKNVVFDADVAKRATRVTVVSAKAMTPRQALQLFVDAVEATGMVVTQKPDTIIIKLGPNMPKGCPDLAAGSGSVDPLASRDITPTPPDPELTDAELDAAIKVIDPTHRELARALIDKVLANPMAAAKGVRLVPTVKNGKPVGFKLFAIRPGSIFGRLGFLNGDTLLSINGGELTSADKALEVYTKLRDAKQLVLQLERRGQPLTLTLSIK